MNRIEVYKYYILELKMMKNELLLIRYCGLLCRNINSSKKQIIFCGSYLHESFATNHKETLLLMMDTLKNYFYEFQIRYL